MVERINRSKSIYYGSDLNNVVFKKVPKYVIEGGRESRLEKIRRLLCREELEGIQFVISDRKMNTKDYENVHSSKYCVAIYVVL